MKIIIGILILGGFWNAGHALVCMNCTSASLEPTAGCHEDFSDEFLIECEETETFCQVTRYEGSFRDLELVQYERTCAEKKVERCGMVNSDEYDGVSCTYTCEGDGCNGMNVFPNEPEFTTPAPPTKSMTSPDFTTEPFVELDTTPEPEATYGPNTTPEQPVVTPEPDSSPESAPEHFTPKPVLSTKAAAPLRCFNCSSNSFDPQDGCDVDNFSDDYLTNCVAEDKFCLVTRMSADVEGSDYIEYERTCSPVAVEQTCEVIDYDYYSATKCVYTCDSDGCNTLSIFPGEKGYTPPATTTELPSTTSGSTQTRFSFFIILHLLCMAFVVLF